MRRTEIVPTGVEHQLGWDEIIVSKTDPQGHLLYINDVFVEISKYAEAELIGQPHSIVRHPEMPRSVFKLLWETIATGQELFAYIVNLSKDGGHYWVLAHVTPTFDANGAIVGYHSNRRAPARAAIAQIEDLYRTILRAENSAGSTPAALEAGTQALNDALEQRGLSYDEFVWNLTNEALEAAR